MRKLLELLYYFVGFFVVNIIVNLVLGNGLDLTGSLVGTMAFMAAYVVLMLGWKVISKKTQSSRDTRQ